MRVLSKLCSLFLLAASIPVAAQDRKEYAGKVLSVQNRVEVQQDTWVPAVVDLELYAVTALRTFSKSRAVVLLADETQLKIRSDSYLELKAVRRSSSLLKRLKGLAPGPAESDLDLSVGEVWMRSKKRPASVKIKTPAVTAAIRGTEFNLRVAPDGESVITVLEGATEIANDQGRLMINAGEQGLARPGQAPTKTILANPENAVQWTFYYSAAVSPRDYPFSEGLSQPAADPALAEVRRHFNHGRLEEALQSLSGQDGAEASQVRGWIYLAQNRLQEAIGQLQVGPADAPRTRLGLSLSHYRLGDWQSAYSFVEDPGSDGALRLQKALLDLVAGDVEASRSLLESLPPENAYYALSQGLLSDVLVVQNDRENARRAARRAVQANPDSPSAQLNLSRVQQSLFDLPEARKSAQRALQLDPAFLQARLQLATLLFGEGLTSRAERLVRQALQEAPLEAEAHSILGFLLLARGKTSQAHQSFQKAIQIDASLSRPRLGLGLVEMRQGDRVEAALRIMEAATLDPRISLYQSYLAKAFYEQRAFEQAFFALDNAQQLDPRDPTPHLYEGIFQEDLNRPGAAVSAFRDSLRLNDNRAVYRSRLLLDQDRSTRNIQLATAYNRLGLTDWANSSAIRSSLDDPSNSSARLFLAGTFLNMRGRILAAGSESLWVRLLQPVNVNSFNTFNDYTTLFESPRMDWTSEGLFGSFDTAQGRLISSGGTARFAYQATFSYDRSNGFRPLNDYLQSYTGNTLFKFALTPESDVFVSYLHQQFLRGDPGDNLLVDEANDPNLRTFTRSNRAEVGYHHRLRPGSELVVLFSGRQIEQIVDDPDNMRIQVNPNLGTDVPLRRSERNPNLNFQAAHLLDFERLRLRYGVDIFEGRFRRRDSTDFVFPSDPPRRVVDEIDLVRRKVRFKSGFVQGDYDVSPRLTLTAGLNYEWSNDDNVFDQEQRSTSRWNPQGGLFFAPFNRTTFRFAAARLLQTRLQESLKPSHINGFPLDRGRRGLRAEGANELDLTRSNVYHWAWDQQLGSRTFLRTSAFYQAESTPVTRRQPPGNALVGLDFSGNLYGGEAVWNQLLREQLSLVTRYTFEHSRDLFSLRHQHEGSWGAFWVHHKGYSVQVEENYFNQSGLLGILPQQTEVWTTNASFSYELPRKVGLVQLRVRNLFNRRYSFLADPFELDQRVPRRQLDVRLQWNF